MTRKPTHDDWVNKIASLMKFSASKEPTEKERQNQLVESRDHPTPHKRDSIKESVPENLILEE